MNLGAPGFTQGMLAYNREQPEIELRRQQVIQQAIATEQLKRQMAARALAGQALYGQFGGGAEPMAAPAVPAPPPGALSPGGGNPAVMPPAPNPMAPGGPSIMAPPSQPMVGNIPALPGPQAGAPAAAPPVAAPPQIPPYRALPTPDAGAEGAPGAVPPPPGVAAAPGASQPKPLDLKSIITGLKASGVKPDQVMDVLDTLAPTMNAQNKQELDLYKATTQAQRAAIAAFTAEFQSYKSRRDVEIKQQEADRRREQGDARIELMKARLGGLVGGSGNLKTTEIVYPKDANGRVDESAEPLGVRGVTKSGKIVYMDREGRQVPSLTGGTAREAKDTKPSMNAATRNKLVQGSAQNALRMLGDIKQKFPTDTTSILMTTHPEGLTESAITGVIRSQQSKHQQNVDTAWKSFIDEAIPVFTGGLRGSDAFRRFLTSQVPLMGAKNNAEIMDLFERNIKGIDRTFANQMLTAFASDKKYWGTKLDGTPVTQEDVDAALQAAQTAPAAAPQPGGAAGGWKVEKVK